MLQCYNRGCGELYDPENNTDESCRYHPGEPYFHDIYKGWTCCQKKSVDFTDFLNFKGCVLTKHSNVKPPEPEKPKKNEYNVERIIVRAPVKALERPPVDSRMTTIKPVVEDNVKEIIDKLPITDKVASKPLDNNTVAVGTSCKHHGCTCTYQGATTKHGKCQYHPGVPIFHEGMKYWSCCKKKTSDFTVFIAQKGCVHGDHKWIDKDNNTNAVQCRHDWHQTATDVIVSIYAKKYHYAQSKIEVNPIRLHVNLVFPEQSKACFDLDIELRGVIDVQNTTAHMFGSKLEITMRKAEPGTWAKLDFPRDKLPPPLPLLRTVALTQKQENKKESESDDDFNLDDIDTVKSGGLTITEINNELD